MLSMAPQSGDGAAVMDMPPDILQLLMMQGMTGNGGGLANMIRPGVQPNLAPPMAQAVQRGSPSFSGLYPSGMGTAVTSTGAAGASGGGGNPIGSIGSLGLGLAGSAFGGPIGGIAGSLLGGLL